MRAVRYWQIIDHPVYPVRKRRLNGQDILESLPDVPALGLVLSWGRPQCPTLAKHPVRNPNFEHGCQAHKVQSYFMLQQQQHLDNEPLRRNSRMNKEALRYARNFLCVQQAWCKR